MDDGDVAFQPYTKLVMTNSMLDCQLQHVERKIKSKTDENDKLERTILDFEAKIERLERDIVAAKAKEEKIKNNIDSHRQSRLMTEGLIMTTKHNLMTMRNKREETKTIRNEIIEKYTKIFQSYQAVYQTLPWMQKNHELKIDFENARIQLNILKLEYSSLKKKIALFNKINEQRIKVVIIKFAKLMVNRTNLKNDIDHISKQIMESELRIEALMQEKLRVQDVLNQKVKAAVVEARERAVKSNTSFGSSKLSVPLIASSKPVRESIFARLGIGGPLTLKRPSTSEPSPVLSKLPCTSGGASFKVPDHVSKPKEKEILEETRKKNHTQLVLTDKPTPSKIKNSVEKPSAPFQTVRHKNPQIVTNPVERNPEPSQQKDKILPQTSCHSASTTNLEDKDENKEKQESSPPKEVSAQKEKPKCHKTVTFFDEKMSEDGKPSPHVEKPAATPPVPKKDKEVEAGREETVGHPAGPEQSLPSTLEDTGAVSRMEDLDDCGSIADASIDTDSVLSLNFVNENRDGFMNELSGRTMESPDFLIQGRQQFCFSPPFGGEEEGIPEKSGKNKNSGPGFMASSNPLFSPPEKEKKTGGQSSFLDFFGNSSPKKNNSQNAFFKLFG